MLGKPVICYLRPEWLESMRREIPEYVDEIPVVSATPETAYETLRDLVESPERRREIGRRSREFAVKWHSADAGARRLEEVYLSLLAGDRTGTGA
jgi:glycosyltransferase involved in cell wall biosynthesis